MRIENYRNVLLPLSVLAVIATARANAAGNLTPKGAVDQEIEIRAHRVHVTLNNGFARTEVFHTFFNGNDTDLEAIYAFPLPESASLSELSIRSGESEIHGEVVERNRAQTIYEEEKAQGNETGLGTKEGFQRFEFRVYPVRAGQQTEIRFVYYQPIPIDTGVGRYLYPLEEGGTDEIAASFWTGNEHVNGPFSIEVDLVSGAPVDEVRVPGYESEAVIDELADGRYRVELTQQDATLDRDFVLYYRLAEDLPGRVELLAHRPDASKPGTFMMVVTPGLDLRPLTAGGDFTFVIDVSGSMAGKLGTMTHGVGRAIGELDPEDRFRVIAFNENARSLTRGFVPATAENVSAMLESLNRVAANGSTNLYAGLRMGLDGLDDDRASSVILVTDAVANEGVVDPRAFHELMTSVDVRVFSFLLGNSANDPLMRVISRASGGFAQSVGNADDVLGQILLAKSKVTHEALHDARLSVRGVRVFDVTEEAIGKVYRGQQLVVMGRYDAGGPARVTLDARLTGQDKSYVTEFSFPEIANDHPELERIWALDRVESLETQRDSGLADAAEVEVAIRDLGLDHQLVTDFTSMVVLSDRAFADRGIERRNAKRLGSERAAQARRAKAPPVSSRVDRSQPMFDRPAPSVGSKRRSGGGGAFDPVTVLIVAGLGGAAGVSRRRNVR